VPQKINQIFGVSATLSHDRLALQHRKTSIANALSYGRSRHFLSWSKGDRELIERGLRKIILDPGFVGQRKLNAESDLWSCKFVG
jgi:hypothetical protein